MEYLERKYKSKIVDIRFRNKTFGYHSGTMKVVFGNGKVYFGSARTNYFLKAFFQTCVHVHHVMNVILSIYSINQTLHFMTVGMRLN